MVLPAGPASAAAPAWTSYDRPAQYGVLEQPNVPITMSDGVVLNAEVHRPDAAGRFPVLVTMTPYNGGSGIIGGANDYFVERGYVHVVVDVRGTGSSAGTWDDLGPREQQDGYELVEWAAGQQWSDGKVGMYGTSYLAITQIFTAALQPPHLKAIFPILPMGDAYRDMVFPGGQNNIGFIPFWLVLVSGSALIPPSYALSGDPDDLARGLETLASHALAFPGFDLNFELDAMAGEGAYDGPRWKTSSPIEVADKVTVPTFIVGGLHDIFQRGEPLLYERLKIRVPTRLLIGPWTHTTVGDGLPADGVPAIDQIALRWLDNYLKGIDTKVKAIPKVTQYTLGEDHYETQTDWPEPSLAPTRLYLRSGASLAPEPPIAPEAPESFLQNPVSGVCTQSTSQWSAGLLGPVPCTRDNRLDETNGVTYTTPPLAQDLRLSGPLFADLWVTTTATDAVVSVRATDVAPDGSSTEVTAGWLAGSFRALDPTRSRYVNGQLLQPWHPFTKDSLLTVTPGVPIELPVEIFPTNAVIKAGHSLRIAVGPNDFPHAVPPALQLVSSLGGIVQVLHDPAHPSYVALPTLGTCPASCKPLPVANLIRG